MYLVTTSDGKLLTANGGKLLVAPLPFTSYAATSGTTYTAPVVVAINPAAFSLQTIGGAKSLITVDANNFVTSVSANSTDAFVSNVSVAARPKLIDAPDLMGAKVLEFGVNCFLELNVPVPATYTGSQARSFYFLVKSQTGNRNIFGYGTNTHYGIYDILKWNSGTAIGIHVFNSGVAPLVSMSNNNTWEVFRSRCQGGSNTITNQTNNSKAVGGHGTLFTSSQSSFRLGGGVFPNYNGNGIVTMAHFEAYDKYTTDEEDAQIDARIRALYGLPVL